MRGPALARPSTGPSQRSATGRPSRLAEPSTPTCSLYSREHIGRLTLAIEAATTSSDMPAGTLHDQFAVPCPEGAARNHRPEPNSALSSQWLRRAAAVMLHDDHCCSWVESTR